jgi:hypothetical protein
MERTCIARLRFSEPFAGLDADIARAPTGRGLFARVIEVFAVAARAYAAAGHYEDLCRRSDAELSLRGLRRADVPRAAFHFLAADR